ncbi:MAG: MBL fold metallo-hydrolase [Bacteroidota bacterium]
MLTYILLSFLVLLILAGTLFLNFYPSFGGNHSAEEKATFAEKANYKKGKFLNEVATDMSFSFSDILTLIGEYRRKDVQRKPDIIIPVNKIDSLEIASYSDTVPRMTWFGHSAFLLEIDNKKILIDPMLGESPAPHPMLGTKRYTKELPIEIAKLPHIDVVIFSHDHYDHLDYESILLLKEKVNHFYVPLGLGAHLIAWGVNSSKIHELDWWEEINHEDLHLACTPARHFSGRGVFNRESTLWASWVIQTKSFNIFFSGDSGYGPHFKEIGAKYGAFDFAMIECGQYNELWADIHMMPEESVQACLDLTAKTAMPIHWGAFTLALHAWTDPITRFLKKAMEKQLPYITPEIGKPILLNDFAIHKTNWWVTNK